MKPINELNLKSKKYIIFDMDGTLIDSIGIWNITDNYLIKKFSGNDIDLKIIQKERESFLEKHQNSDIYLEYCKYLIEKYKMSITPKSLLDLIFETAGKYLENEIDFKPYVPELLKELKNKGYILVLATATTKVSIDIYTKKNKKMLNKLNIADYFDLIIKKEDVKNKKPHPEIYLKVLKYYKALPNECLVFEDSLHGIQAATKAGIETVNIYDSYSDSNREEIDKIADYKIKTYLEILNLLN